MKNKKKIYNLEQTFRWFGPTDLVSLAAIRQTGASGIVTALHHIPAGEIWSVDEIMMRKRSIEKAGLVWSVVESLNIHESIKTGSSQRDEYIDKYITSIKNLGSCGLNTICYNFMPVLDWTRTDLNFKLSNNASALRYHSLAVIAFDLYILEREAAFKEFSSAQQNAAKVYLDGLTALEKEYLINTILAGLPGTEEVYTVTEFREELQKYANTDAVALRSNLTYFLKAIMPYAERAGVKMCIHPDDPPFPILGLPRVVSTEEDLKLIVDSCPSPNNGLTFCSGSLGARADNDLPGIIERLGEHIHFLHLRNVKREPDGSFYEDDHLAGSTNMFAVMKCVILEQEKRLHGDRLDVSIPIRPDHGHKILDDLNYNTYPGYSAIGRLKGLAELRGLEMGIKGMLFN